MDWNVYVHHSPWLWALLTLGMLTAYELLLFRLARQTPTRLARGLHANMREDWFESMGQNKGTEVLGVQTLRNSLMSSSLIVSTSALGLMGTLTLTVPRIQNLFGQGEVSIAAFSPKLIMDLALLMCLFASLVFAVMAVRYYNHASFVVGMPVDSQARQRWNPVGVSYVRKAGVLYGLGLRQLLLIAPLIAHLLNQWAGPVVAMVVLATLWQFDRSEAL